MSRFRLLEPWRSRLLWLSLALNLFGAAMLAAPHLWRRPPGPPNFGMMIERMSRNLDAPDAAALRAAMAKEQPWYDMSRGRLDEARRDIAARVAQQPYDPAAVHAALAAMQDRIRESTSRFDDSLVDALGRLSPEGRTKLAHSLRRGPR